MAQTAGNVLSILLLVILPLITLATGILSLYVDPKSEPRKKRTLILVLVLSAGATAAASVHDQNAHRVEADTLRDDLSTTKALVAATKESTDRTRTLLANLVANLTDTYGYAKSRVNARDLTTDQVALLEKSASADNALQTLPAVPSFSAAIKPTVRYFAKDLDPKVVQQALAKQGFSVDVRPPHDTNPTNVIWIGDNITADEARTVALILVRAGVQLNAILRFRDGTGSRAKLIEVGAHEGYRTKQFLSVEQIQAMKEFPPDQFVAPSRVPAGT